MDNLHIEDSTEGEGWKTGSEEERERDRERRTEGENLSINDLKMI